MKAGIREAARRAYREKYGDFGPTFAAEKLAEAEGIKTSDGTLRQRLIAEGLRAGRRGRKEHRGRRERRASFGEPARFDGSHHRRFEKRGIAHCLITMTDDATNARHARFERRHFQILKSNMNLPRPKDKVTVLIKLDGSFCIRWKNNSLLVKEIETPENGLSGNNAA